jgi:hypothetical protein
MGSEKGISKCKAVPLDVVEALGEERRFYPFITQQ